MPAPFETRPGPEESTAYYQDYIGEVPGGDLTDNLIIQTGTTREILSPLTEEAAGRRYARGKWSIKEVLGHILDSERVMGYRLLRIARGDATPLHGFDQDTYAVAGRFDRRPLAALLAEYAAVRTATIELIRSLDEEDLARRGTANDNPVSVRALAWIIAGHERHHLRVVRERYDLS